MKRISLFQSFGAGILTLVGLISVPLYAATNPMVEAEASASVHAEMPTQHREFFEKYCTECHGPEKQKGKVRLDDISFRVDTLKKADEWAKILNSINSGDMPPEDAKQPENSQKADFLEALSQTMVVARKALSDQGGNITMRRLNRREYQNTLRELLGVEINVGTLPADGSSENFDTVGSALFMSPDQFMLYRELGRKALDLSFQMAWAESKVQKHHIEPELEVSQKMEKDLAYWNDIRKRYRKWTVQVDAAARAPENGKLVAELREKTKVTPAKFYLEWEKIGGAPAPKDFGFSDAIDANMMNERWETHVPYLVEYLTQPKAKTGAYLCAANIQRWVNAHVPDQWPAGEYKAKVRLAATKEAPEKRRFIDFVAGFPSNQVLSSHQVTGTMEEPQVLEIPFKLEAGAPRGFMIAEKSMLGNPDGFSFHDILFQEGYNANRVGPEFAVWIDWIEFEGPFKTAQVAESLAKIRADLERLQSDQTDVRRYLSNFAEKACRGRKLDEDFLNRLVGLYEARRKDGEKVQDAIKEPLTVLLASPSFLYLAEPAEQGKPRLLTDLELATRLAFFLWSSPPDDELLRVAAEGQLQKPEVLAQQVDRLLASPKSDRFVRPFVQQWLGLSRLDFFQFNIRLYPEFDLPTKANAKNEVFETFAHLLKKGDTLSKLLKSDSVVINGLLAGYYKIPGVTGDAFREVSLPSGSPRGGLLGMAAILAMGSNGEQTSPVERGAWVMRKVLHDPPPPAPPNVPQLNRLSGKPLTTRERIAQHQEDAQCTQCHRKIDPVGFGLENFDAAGRWREIDLRPGVPQKRNAIDASGVFFKGAAFKDFFEMRDLVAAKPERIAAGFTEALIEYGLGRTFGFSDAALAADIVEQAAKKNFAIPEFIHALVASTAFHSK
ncbi:MAG: DUF1592 domain-containing protein [Verrucomicrobiota bacterium]